MNQVFLIGLIVGTVAALGLILTHCRRWIRQGFAFARNEAERKRMGWTEKKENRASFLIIILVPLAVIILKLVGVVAPETGFYDFIGVLAFGLVLSFFPLFFLFVLVYDRRLRRNGMS